MLITSFFGTRLTSYENFWFNSDILMLLFANLELVSSIIAIPIAFDTNDKAAEFESVLAM